MARAYRFTTQVPGFEVWIEYNANNRQIQSANWIVPAGVVARAFVWENGVIRINQVLTGTGSSVIAGNYRVIEGVDDWGVPRVFLPPEITYRFECN